MIATSYTLTLETMQLLKVVEQLRAEILLTPLRPQIERQLRWENLVKHVYISNNMAGMQIPLPEAIQVLNLQKHASTPEQKAIYYLKLAFDELYESWLGNSKPFNVKTALELCSLVLSGECSMSKQKLLRSVVNRTIESVDTLLFAEYEDPMTIEQNMAMLFNYLQVRKENPIVQAAVAQAQIFRIAPFAQDNGKMARLLSWVFLYKHGYDIRGLWNFEEILYKDQVGYYAAIEMAAKEENLTSWIIYFAQLCIHALTKSKDIIHELVQADTLKLPSFLALSRRQQAILATLINPEMKITNKMVQKEYGITQLTASRDLAKLRSLGLIKEHGKGRSIFYTRISF